MKPVVVYTGNQKRSAEFSGRVSDVVSRLVQEQEQEV